MTTHTNPRFRVYDGEALVGTALSMGEAREMAVLLKQGWFVDTETFQHFDRSNNLGDLSKSVTPPDLEFCDQGHFKQIGEDCLICARDSDENSSH